MSDASWKSSVEADLGVKLGQWQPMSGGDFAASFTATVSSKASEEAGSGALQSGMRIFVKTHASPPPNHFSTEARGLQWLGETRTVRVPRVLGVCDNIPYLAIAWVEEARQRFAHPGSEAEFGRDLAALHQSECGIFGRSDKRSTGSQGLPNEPLQHWAKFYATQRLLPLARLATECHALEPDVISDIETLADRLDELGPSGVTPSRLHGDLWAGNRLVDADGQSWVIDPASHGGHREFDLAMMRLFGGYGDACFDAYDEAYPLDAGWRERIALHQLAPLIVHAIKFGGAYAQATRDALSQYV